MLIRFTPDAEAELAEARQWYAHQREDLDVDFMQCIDQALSRVIANPHVFPIVYENLRRVVVRRFPFAVFYEVTADEIQVIAVSILVAILRNGRRERDSMVKGIYKSSWWSIDLLPGWWTDEEPRCTTFFREDGVGALQISAYKTETVTIPETDLRDFTEGQFPDGIALQTVDCGEFSGNGVEYVADGKFWLKRWVSKGPLLLYITYNSDANPRNLESVDIGHMLDTLKALDVA